MSKVIILGPAYPFRGGIATFNDQLYLSLIDQGHEVELVTFSLQYPKILFPGKSQYRDDAKAAILPSKEWLNSINPINWWRTGNKLAKMNADILIVRYWLPFMSPALSTVCKRVKANSKTKAVALIDNLIPHEARPGDRQLTHYFTQHIDAAVVMSKQVARDLQDLNSGVPYKLIPHPIFNHMGNKISKLESAKILNLNPSKNYLLFFGLIRKYKGVDLLIEAMNLLIKNAPNTELIIAGESYEEEKIYLDLIEKFQLKNSIHFHNRYIPDDAVAAYFGIADAVVLPYKTATQSGVTQLAYHFEKPMILTKVGGLTDFFEDGKEGIVVNANVESIASGISKFYNLSKTVDFVENLGAAKSRFDKDSFVKALIEE